MSYDIKSLNVILQDPRKGWPTLDAIGKGWVHHDSELIKKIEELLDKNRICIIRSAEGRGKTVLARLVGFERQEKNWDVFIIEASESKNNIESICNTICHVGDKKRTLFIIENAHTSDKIPSEFVETANKSQKASFIFTARKIFSEETSDDDFGNPFEEWIGNGWCVDLSPDLKTICNIIENFTIEKNRKYTLSPEDELWIKKEFGNEMPNLRRLRFYLEAWNSKGNAPLSSIKREDILENVYKNYIEPLIDPNRKEMLIKVAAVFQFDVNFSGKNFDRNLLEELCNNGVITFLQGYFYRLQHSTDAAYIIEAEAVLREGKDPVVLTLSNLKNYLREWPENYFELLRALSRNDNILSTIFEDSEIYEIIFNMVRQDRIEALSNVMGCLLWSRGKEKGLEFWERHKKSYGSLPEEQKKKLKIKINEASFNEILFLLFIIKKLDIKERDWLLNEILGADGLICKAKESSLSTLSTIVNFLRLARQSGIGEGILKSFCEPSDWKILGEAAGKKIGESKNPFFELHSVQRYSFISKDMALQFVEGIGWDRLNKAINEQFSPDILAAAKKLLTKKCSLTHVQLKEKGIDLEDHKIWLNSFMNRPCPIVSEKQQSIQKNYLTYAGNKFKSIENKIDYNSLNLSLKSWNIFIHNISATCPAEYLKGKIIPLFASMPAERLEKLICESDLYNIGIFLNRFNPEDGIFKWSIPKEIDFKRIKFLENIGDSTLEAISHFLFNFYFIDRGECSHYFAEEIGNNYSTLIPKITNASIAELDFFFWNLWMAMPKGKKPLLFSNKEIMEIILKKLAKEKKDKESILGLIGTLNMSMSPVNEELTSLIDAKTAKAICQKAVTEGSIKFIRLMGGCLLLLPKDDLIEIYKGIQETNFQFNIQVPNQIEALSFIKESSL
ncbi:MAG: hypothetical protein HYV59_15305 [Planctomycetes bacterium]|nr:hypothetical protein [Planctomycetota bacterium]